MKIRQILSKNCICSHLESTTKEGILSELANLLALNYPQISQDEIAHTLMDREKLGSTGIGNGIAIPHGKISSLSQIVTAFGRSLPGVSFESQDGQPSHLFFVLLAPENAASLHLKALARLSRILKDQEFRTHLMEAGTENELYNAIMSEDDKF